MLKSILAAAALAAAFATGGALAADVNKADQAELESVKGVGPALSTRILDERKKSAFKDWDDLMTRVKGLGPGNAAKFSEAGMTVGGQAFKGAEPAAKPAKAEKKAESAKPAKS
jgi:competence protein ComEA